MNVRQAPQYFRFRCRLSEGDTIRQWKSSRYFGIPRWNIRPQDRDSGWGTSIRDAVRFPYPNIMVRISFVATPNQVCPSRDETSGCQRSVLCSFTWSHNVVGYRVAFFVQLTSWKLKDRKKEMRDGRIGRKSSGFPTIPELRLGDSMAVWQTSQVKP